MTPRVRPRRTRSAGSTRLLAAGALVALLGGMAYIVLSSGETESGRTAAPTTTPAAAAPTTAPVKKPPARVGIAVSGIGAYDPEGDRSENGADARLATDGDATTSWKSEHYRTSFRKSGIGLVLDAGKPVKASRVIVTSETPGFAARVQVGASPTGPFTSASGSKTTTGRTVYALKPRNGRYLVIWITSMPADGVAAVNEVRVSAGG